MKHELTQYESDFLEPGYKAECSCGWMSERVPTMQSAQVEHQIHAREQAKEAPVQP
jgi:hypothetical protein